MQLSHRPRGGGARKRPRPSFESSNVNGDNNTPNAPNLPRADTDDTAMDGEDDDSEEEQDPPEVDEDPSYFVEKIHDVRHAHRRLEFLIEWEDFPNREDFTWEPMANLPNDKDKIADFKAAYLESGKVWPTSAQQRAGA